MNIVGSSEPLGMLHEIELFIAQDNPERASVFIDLFLEKGDSCIIPRNGKSCF